LDLRNARILLSNDDSIHAEGFAALERIARSLSDDVWVCAPETEQSGAGHSLTIHRPLRLRQVAEKRFAVDGTPTDCVLLAINHVLAGRPPDLVLSGVNHGRNAADDVTYSGTIAAAMEATLLGVRAVALSQAKPPDAPPDFSAAEVWGPKVIRQVLEIDWPDGVLMNVNFPNCPADRVAGIRHAHQGGPKTGDTIVERIDPRGRAYFWIGGTHSNGSDGEHTDLGALAAGYVSVTPLNIDLTDVPTLERLGTVL